MASETGFIATSPILAKILKDEHRNISPEKQNDSDAQNVSNGSLDNGREMEIESQRQVNSKSTPDHREHGDIEVFMAKLASSPRKMDSLTKIDINSSQDEQCSSDIQQDTNISKAERKDNDLHGQRYNMAWKSDLHGFYQTSMNDGFLNRFHSHDEDESEQAQQNLCNVEINYHEESISGGESSLVGKGKSDYSELLKDVVGQQAIGDSSEQLSLTVPLVFVQPPTPSRLSSCTPSVSSNGSSRSETPELDDSEAAFDREPRLMSEEEEHGSMSGALRDKNRHDKIPHDDDGGESLQLEFEGQIESNDKRHCGTNETFNCNRTAKDWSGVDRPPPFYDNMDEDGDEAQQSACSGSVSGDNEADNMDKLHNGALVYEDMEDDSSSSLEQVSNALLTSWTEQQMKHETSDVDVSDTVTFDHRTSFSPTVTWRTANESTARRCADNGDDVLQTSIGSATDLREVLERSLQKELDICETVVVEGDGFRKGAFTGALQTTAGEGVREKALSINRFTVTPRYEDRNILSGDVAEDSRVYEDMKGIEELSGVKSANDTSGLDTASFVEMVRHGSEPDAGASNYMQGWKTKERFRKDSGLARNLSDEFGAYLEDLEAISLLRSVEIERAKLEMVRGIRSKMEETCNGVPIEKIPSFVYDQWDEVLHSLADEENLRLREMQAEHESILQGMRSELDNVRRDNLGFSKISADKDSCELDNALLRKQIGGLEDFVTSLEGRIEGRAKENAKLLEEIDELRRLSAEKDNDLKVMGKDYDSKLKDARQEIGKLKEAVLKLENDVKMKELENRKISAHNDKEKDEMQNDLVKVNSNVSILRNKLTELQNENHTFKVANEADQTIIKHLETKLQNASQDMTEVKAEKSNLLAELEGSRSREADLKKKQLATEKERGSLELEKSRILERLRFVQEEKKSIERQLNDKLNTDMKNAESMLQEIKSLESSLNSVRTEKSYIEDKYNNLKFELERLQLAQNGEKQVPSGYAAGREDNQQSSNFDGKTDFVISSHDFPGSNRVSNKQYSIAARSSLETIPSLETCDGVPSAGTSSVVTRSIGSNLSFREDLSHLSSILTRPTTPFQKTAGTEGMRKAYHIDDKFAEKRSTFTPEEPQKSLGRESSLNSSLFSELTVDSKYRSDARNSDEESVASYPDFPRASGSVPPVLVVRTKTLPLKGSSDSVGSSKQTPGRGGNVKPPERSRLVEREDTMTSVDSRDSRRDSKNGRQSIGDAKSKQRTESQKSITYSVEDTRSWLRSMESKLEQTDQILKAMKKNKHVKV